MEMGAVSAALSEAAQSTQAFVVYYGGRAWSYGLEQGRLFGNWVATSISNLWVNAQPYLAHILEQSRNKCATGAVFVYNNPIPSAIALSLVVVAVYIIHRMRSPFEE